MDAERHGFAILNPEGHHRFESRLRVNAQTANHSGIDPRPGGSYRLVLTDRTLEVAAAGRRQTPTPSRLTS